MSQYINILCKKMIQIIKHESSMLAKCSTCYNINIIGANLYNIKVEKNVMATTNKYIHTYLIHETVL